MKYSIIVPIYNMERYLRECIDSIVKQKRTDVEVILVNDGSTDGSLAICKEYENEYSYITVLDKPNTGSMDSWIKGVELSKGEYICFVDADDSIEENYFSVIDKYVKQDKYDIILFDFTRIYKEHTSYKAVNKIEYGEIAPSVLAQIKNNYYCAHEMCSLYRWDKVIKSELIKANINKVTYRGVYFEDQITLLNLFSAEKVIYIKERLYRYRMRKSSVSHGFKYRIFNDNLKMEQQMYELAKDFGYDKKQLYYLHLYFLCHYAKNALRAPKNPEKVKVRWKDIFSVKANNQKMILLLYKLKFKSMFNFLMRKKHQKERNGEENYFD